MRPLAFCVPVLPRGSLRCRDNGGGVGTWGSARNVCRVLCKPYLTSGSCCRMCIRTKEEDRKIKRSKEEARAELEEVITDARTQTRPLSNMH